MTKEAFLLRCEEAANLLNGFYGWMVQADEVATAAWDDFRGFNENHIDCTPEEKAESYKFTLLGELENNTYSDTNIRELLLDLVCQNRIGLCAPCYGKSIYKRVFDNKMSQWLAKNR